MKKAVAIPYIIALIIGIIVVVVLAFWLISSGGKGSGIGNEAECTARKVEFCATQTNDAWNKVIEKCGIFNDCYNYCTSIIPKWNAVSGNSHCPEPSQS